MKPSPSATTDLCAEPWWVRLHCALMPDYNRQATAYWWFMVLLGAGILMH